MVKFNYNDDNLSIINFPVWQLRFVDILKIREREYVGSYMVTPVYCYQLVSIKVKVQVMCRESCNSTSKAESELLVAL